MSKCNHSKGQKPRGKIHVDGHIRTNKDGSRTIVSSYDRKK